MEYTDYILSDSRPWTDRSNSPPKIWKITYVEEKNTPHLVASKTTEYLKLESVGPTRIHRDVEDTPALSYRNIKYHTCSMI